MSLQSDHAATALRACADAVERNPALTECTVKRCPDHLWVWLGFGDLAYCYQIPWIELGCRYPEALIRLKLEQAIEALADKAEEAKGSAQRHHGEEGRRVLTETEEARLLHKIRHGMF